jgi:hypothetical protein
MTSMVRQTGNMRRILALAAFVGLTQVGAFAPSGCSRSLTCAGPRRNGLMQSMVSDKEERAIAEDDEILPDVDFFAMIDDDDDDDDDDDEYDEDDEQVQGDVTLYSDEWENGIEPAAPVPQTEPWKKNARWESLNPRVKLRIIEAQQAKAIENKKKREPIADKKRRELDIHAYTSMFHSFSHSNVCDSVLDLLYCAHFFFEQHDCIFMYVVSLN